MTRREFERLETGTTVYDRNGLEMIVRSISGDMAECQELEVDDDGNGSFSGAVCRVTRHDITL